MCASILKFCFKVGLLFGRWRERLLEGKVFISRSEPVKFCICIASLSLPHFPYYNNGGA